MAGRQARCGRRLHREQGADAAEAPAEPCVGLGILESEPCRARRKGKGVGRTDAISHRGRTSDAPRWCVARRASANRSRAPINAPQGEAQCPPESSDVGNQETPRPDLASAHRLRTLRRAHDPTCSFLRSRSLAHVLHACALYVREYARAGPPRLDSSRAEYPRERQHPENRPRGRRLALEIP